MAIQTINIGAAPNDNTGDDLRAAGTKINANFQELYAQAVKWLGNLNGKDANTFAHGTGFVSQSNATNAANNLPNLPMRLDTDGVVWIVETRDGVSDGSSTNIIQTATCFGSNLLGWRFTRIGRNGVWEIWNSEISGNLQIPSAQDLNNYTYTGVFAASFNSTVTGGTNFPPTSVQGTLVVYRKENGASSGVMQEWYSYNDTLSWRRIYNPNSGWSAWAVNITSKNGVMIYPGGLPTNDQGPIAKAGVGMLDWNGSMYVPRRDLDLQGGLILTGMKNRVINGGFNLNQRAFTPGSQPANGQRPADRWQISYFDSGTIPAFNCGINAGTNAPAFANSLNCFIVYFQTGKASIAAGENFQFRQYIEGFGVQDFKVRPFTLSFLVIAKVPGKYAVSIRNTDGSKSFIGTFTINSADTWESKSIPVPALPVTSGQNFASGIGVSIAFTLYAGSGYVGAANQWVDGNLLTVSGAANAASVAGGYFGLTDVQFEAGSVATPFENISMELQYQLAMRYYETGYYPDFYTNSANTATAAYGNVTFKVRKRAAPTLASKSPVSATQPSYYSNGNNTAFTPAFNIANEGFNFTASGLTGWNGWCGILGNSTWQADAELG